MQSFLQSLQQSGVIASVAVMQQLHSQHEQGPKSAAQGSHDMCCEMQQQKLGAKLLHDTGKSSRQAI